MKRWVKNVSSIQQYLWPNTGGGRGSRSLVAAFLVVFPAPDQLDDLFLSGRHEPELFEAALAEGTHVGRSQVGVVAKAQSGHTVVLLVAQNVDALNDWRIRSLEMPWIQAVDGVSILDHANRVVVEMTVGILLLN